MFSLKRKMKMVLESPTTIRKIPVTVDNVSAVKIRWLYYQTSAEGEKDMQIRISEIDGNGMYVKEDGSNAKYLMAMPLDQNAAVTVTYSNFNLNEYDAVYTVPIASINELNFEVRINDVIANQITPSNPLVLELGFYA